MQVWSRPTRSEEIHGAPTCQAFLSAVRAVAKKNGDWTDRACAVLGDDHPNGYYFVESYEGKIVWEGKAHCRWCARAQAITRMAGKEAA